MDPQACLDRLIDALHDGELQEVTEAAADYAEWTYKGGFLAMPKLQMTPDSWKRLCVLIARQ